MNKKLCVIMLISGLFFSFGISHGKAIAADSWSILELSLFSPVSLPPFVDNVYGFRGNVIYGENKSVQGFDLGLLQSCSERMTGLQIGILGNSTGVAEGLQIGGIANISENIRAVQIASLINYSKTVTPYSCQIAICNLSEDGGGAQLGLLNAADKVHWDNSGAGCQIGFWNACNENCGMQIGLINITDDLNGFQMGLFNISKDHFTMFFNWKPYESTIR